MVTTTIRIEDDMKARVAAAAERGEKTTHAFILNAIAETVTQAEQDEAFHRLAEGADWRDGPDRTRARGSGALRCGRTYRGDHAGGADSDA